MKTLSIVAVLLVFSMANAQNDKPFSTTTKLKGDLFIGNSVFRLGSQSGTQSTYDNMSKLISSKPTYVSAGSGLVYGANLNYFPVDYFGFGAGYSHLSGNWQTINTGSYSNGFGFKEEFRGNYDCISMDVILRTCCEGQWHGQASFGPSFFPGSNTQFKRIDGFNGSTDYDIRHTITNTSGFGFNAGFGGDYQINDHLSIGIDFKSNIFNATGKNDIYTKYMDKGTDNLPDMKTNSKETVYVDEMTQNSNSTGLQGYDVNKPTNALAPKTNFNNFIGVLRTTFTF